MDLPVSDAKFAQQAKDYATTVKACMEVDSCIGFTIWDFYDPVCFSLYRILKRIKKLIYL